MSTRSAPVMETAFIPGWRVRAACREIDPDLFFPIGTEGPALAQAEEAKRVCASCPVRMPCLDWAMDHHEKDGIWGGMTEQERHLEGRRQHRRRRAAA